MKRHHDDSPSLGNAFAGVLAALLILAAVLA